MLDNNLKIVEDKISEAALKSNKTREDIKLVAVTKTHGIEAILEAIENGVTDIGENRVQELMQKMDSIPENINIHMIGQLQTNKVKYIIERVNLIQSLDRESLLKTIEKEAAKINKVQDCLIQVNLTDDENRAGVKLHELKDFAHLVSNYPHVNVKGLMCVAPLYLNKNELIQTFDKIRLAFNDLRCYNINNVRSEILSMGMSDDYELAIECGSNMVRVGSAIFGKRV